MDDQFSPIAIELWGRDHWTTYAYLGNRWLNNEGQINRDQMRCHPEIHPHLAHRMSSGKYPTRLKDGTVVAEHDDWSCLEDAVHAGLLEEIGTGANPVFRFTDLGWQVWFQMVRHIAEHPRNWSATFEPTLGDVDPLKPGASTSPVEPGYWFKDEAEPLEDVLENGVPLRKRVADTISFVAADDSRLRLTPYQAADATIRMVRDAVANAQGEQP